MNKGKSNRLGKVYIHESLYYDLELVSKIFSIFYPSKTEFIHHNKTFEYIGWSPYFRSLKEGEKIPTYKITFHKNLGQTLIYSIDEEIDE